MRIRPGFQTDKTHQNKLYSQNRNSFCTSHTQGVIIGDISGGHSMSQFRICDLCHTLKLDLFGHMLFTSVTNAHTFIREWYKPVFVSVFEGHGPE